LDVGSKDRREGTVTFPTLAYAVECSGQATEDCCIKRDVRLSWSWREQMKFNSEGSSLLALEDGELGFLRL